MSDFRVPSPLAESSPTQRELDWDQIAGRWSASEREYGAAEWIQDLDLNPSDTAALTAFFVIDDSLGARSLTHLSPGELSQVHRQQGGRQIVAGLCPKCGGHWLIFKMHAGQWRKYGRTCNFGWFRAMPISADTDEDFQRANANCVIAP